MGDPRLPESELDRMATSLVDALNEIRVFLLPFNKAIAAAENLVGIFKQADNYSTKLTQQKAELDRLQANITEGVVRRDELLLQLKGIVDEIEKGKAYLAEHRHDHANSLIEKMKVISGGRK